MARTSVVDWLGKRIGALSIVSRAVPPQGVKHRETWWMGVCDCGESRIIPHRLLKRRPYLTCGRGKCPFRQPTIFGKGNPRVKDVPWQLDMAIAHQLQTEPCAYCGDAHPKTQGVLTLVDPRLPYRLDNVLTICQECARLKGNRHTHFSFLALIQRIAEHVWPDEPCEDEDSADTTPTAATSGDC